MIKAAGRTRDDQPLLMLGVSGENMTRLMADEPILINTDDLGHVFSGLPSLSIVLFGGRDEAALTAQMRQLGVQQLDDGDVQPSIDCPKCGSRSYNHNDIREGYCGNCHDYTTLRTPPPMYYRPPTPQAGCTTCGGTGSVTCPACKGGGCDGCGGTGKIGCPFHPAL